MPPGVDAAPGAYAGAPWAATALSGDDAVSGRDQCAGVEPPGADDADANDPRRDGGEEDDWLRRLDLFARCGASFVDEVMMIANMETFRPGQVVVREGMESSSLMVICRGSVEVFCGGKLLCTLCEGGSFGEAQLLGVRARAREGVRARTHVRVRVLTRRALQQVLAKHLRERALFQRMAAEKMASELEIQQGTRETEDLEQMKREDLHIRRTQRALRAEGRSASRVETALSWRGGRQLPLSARGGQQCWQSLADWHRQLAASPEARRLDLWQLSYYGKAEGARDSASPPPPQHSVLASPSTVFSTLESRPTVPSPLPPRPPSSAGVPGTPVPCVGPGQPPYPQLPKTSPSDPACSSSAGRSRQPPASARGGSCGAYVHRHRSHRPSKAQQRGSRSSGCGGAVRRRPDGASEAPPSVTEAVSTLSKGFTRNQWHRQCLKGATAECAGMPRPAAGSRAPAAAASVSFSPTPPAEGGERGTPTPDFETLLAHDAPPVLDSASRKAPALAPARRLEVILRGAFKVPPRFPSEEDDDADDVWDEHPDAHRMSDDVAARASPEVPLVLRAVTTTPSRAVAFRCHAGSTEDDEEDDRERMGFALREGGALPSGRSSVPAVRGSHSAPPRSMADEGIELDSLEKSVLCHIRKALARCLNGGPSQALALRDSAASSRAPSRAASRTQSQGDALGEKLFDQDDDVDEDGSVAPSPCASPSPCPSPAWAAASVAEEELRLHIDVRLLKSRCGSSSAVLALTLDHTSACHQGGGCCCWPAPGDAEVRLVAHFARHSLLRLAAARPPVRVLLEPLPSSVREDSEEEDEV